MKVAIIKYNAGNIYSVDYALKRLGVEGATVQRNRTSLATMAISSRRVQRAQPR